jgi:hypothetical protein
MALPVRPPARFLHGTKVQNLERFDIRRSSDDNPLGPGVYLTTDLVLAQHCAGAAGAVLAVQVDGDPRFVLDLDQPLKKQPSHCAAAVSVLLKFSGWSEQLDYGLNAREAIDLVVPKLGKRYRNAFLASSGVWMLRGHLQAKERCGPGDSGVQYVLLDTRSVVDFYVHAAAISGAGAAGGIHDQSRVRREY